jgi:hypothetical protein
MSKIATTRRNVREQNHLYRDHIQATKILSDVSFIHKKKSHTGELMTFDDPDFPKPLRRKWFAKLYPDYIYDGDRIGFAMTEVGDREETYKNEVRDEEIIIILKETNKVMVKNALGGKAEAREVQMLEVLVRTEMKPH